MWGREGKFCFGSGVDKKQERALHGLVVNFQIPDFRENVFIIFSSREIYFAISNASFQSPTNQDIPVSVCTDRVCLHLYSYNTYKDHVYIDFELK